ncbi:chloride channel protein [Hyperthermus butylicus]|uniref:Voltage-gated chloride channel protein n=1 Tax=Hyperthermus butylicus (strain DSM 5456 / JCM 9403 / PLM1-5) TaxID=415426 RepID=A2BJY0_HYPBU|nr:chloride channel protein [Hyperthermus butylicus]ABM80291.1 Voltage-gated chloride channel protein [Hyperthermus butylicus DSM 5456]
MRRLRIPSLEKWVMLGTLVGVVSGLAGTLLTVGIEVIAELFAEYSGIDLIKGEVSEPSLVLPLLVALGGLASGLLTYMFAPEAEGHGTDSVLEAFHWRGAFIRPRVPLVKLAASSALIGLGGSAGKEGPIALIGAGFGSVLADILHLTRNERRLLVLAGVAGGISAVFRAPLGAMLFALEVPYKRDMEVEAILPLGVASIVAYVASVTILGSGRLLWLPEVGLQSSLELVLYAVLGIVAGLVAKVYVRLFYEIRDAFKVLPIPVMLKPALGGLVAGFIGLLLPHTLGQGYPFLERALLGKLALPVIVAAIIGKMLTNAFSIASGGSGGVFAPSLFIGGMLGAAFAQLYTDNPATIASFSVVGMAAFFAAAGKVPFTSIIIVSEITRGYELIVPSVVAVTLSYVVSGQDSIYEKQVNTRADSPYFLRELGERLLRQIKVRDIMTRSVVVVRPDDPLKRVIELTAETHHTGFPVVVDGRVVGMITLSDVLRYRHSELGKVKVKEAMTRSVIAVLPDDSLADALRKMLRYGIGRLPVVENYESMKLIGIITKKDIVRAYETIRSIP